MFGGGQSCQLLIRQVFKQQKKIVPDKELTVLPSSEHRKVAAGGRELIVDVRRKTVPKKSPPEQDLDLDQDFELVLEPEPIVPAHEMLSKIPPAAPQKEKGEPQKVQASTPANGQAFTTDDFLSDLAKEMDELGLGELTRPVGHAPEETAPASARAAGGEKSSTRANTESGPLEEVFDEFRAELVEMGAEDAGLETHYNLEIRFREMGRIE